MAGCVVSTAAICCAASCGAVAVSTGMPNSCASSRALTASGSMLPPCELNSMTREKPSASSDFTMQRSCALRRQFFSNGAANAAAGTGYQCNFTF